MADVFNPGSMPAARSTNGEFRRGIMAGAIAGLIGGGVLGLIIGAAMNNGPESSEPAPIGAREPIQDRVLGTDEPDAPIVPGEGRLDQDGTTPAPTDRPGVR